MTNQVPVSLSADRHLKITGMEPIQLEQPPRLMQLLKKIIPVPTPAHSSEAIPPNGWGILIVVDGEF